jgi:hypothetical protein
LSQLSQAAGASAGDSGQFDKLTWEEFVQLVIELTIRAYREMRRACPVRRDWEENTFTILLGDDYLRPLAFDHFPSLHVGIRTKVHTPAMKTGRQETIEAKEIDLSLYGDWERDYLRKHFVWEAKRVGDKRIDAKYSNLNSEYVNEAIYRFIERDYAAHVDDAGVLGYVLAGEASNIVNDINQTMGRLRKRDALPPSNHLQPDTPHAHFEDIYRSRHIRTDNSPIQLHHLFFTFDFS